MLAIHGGAGNFGVEDLGAERLAACRGVLREAMRAGKAVLDRGASSLDVVEAAIVVLEDSPLFNAGRGAVFTHEGTHELDACIMSGAQQRAGAVAGARRIRNPIRAARAVLERSEHVLLCGHGSDMFAEMQGLELVEPSYFSTAERRRQLDKSLEREKTVLDHEGDAIDDTKFGTVGAVALDHAGVLAAGTSTGGMTNKRFGRIGDSPIIGAGTFSDAHVAVSCTGHGEFFMRYAVAHELAARLRLANQRLDAAAASVIRELKEHGGAGALIAIDRSGTIAMPMNTTGMFRGWLDKDGEIQIAVFADETP